MRPIDRTLTSPKANTLRNRIYEAGYRVPATELI